MKVAIYVRVSTRDKQDINTQLIYLKSYAERENLEVINIYSDVGESGKKDSRPAFNDLINDLRNGKCGEGILVYKLDRIGRSLLHLIQLFEEFKNRNINFISATQNINTNTPEGRMFLNMLMVLAEYERELIVSRVNDGLGRAKSEGKILGRPKNSKDKKKRRLSGYNLRWVKERQNKHKVKTGESLALETFE